MSTQSSFRIVGYPDIYGLLRFSMIMVDGGEFTGYSFQRFLEKANIKKINTNITNSICDWMHKPLDMHFDQYSIGLISTQRALNKISSGLLGFNRHMFQIIPLKAVFLALQNMRQRKMQINLIKLNKKR